MSRENRDLTTQSIESDDGGTSDNGTSVELSLTKQAKINTEINKITASIRKNLEKSVPYFEKTAKILRESYAFFDSCYIANSSFRLIVDILEPDNDAALTYILRTPAGIAGMIMLGGLLSLLAYASNKINPKGRSDLQVAMIGLVTHLYRDLREFAQSTKYAWKAVNIFLKLLSKVARVDLPLMPIIGVVVPFVIITRIAMRHLRDKRKQLTKANEVLLKILEDGKVQDGFLVKQIKHINAYLHYLSLVVVILNSVVDGFYNYFGMVLFLQLALLPVPIVAIMLTLCSIYGGMLIISRTMEEYQQQQLLEVSAIDCELQIKFNKYCALSDRAHQLIKSDPHQELEAVKADLIQCLKEWTALKERKEKLNTGFYASVFWTGLRRGIDAMSVLGTATAMLAVIFPLAGLALPPILPMLVVMLGVGCLLGGIVFTYIDEQKKRDKEQLELPPPEASFAKKRLSTTQVTVPPLVPKNKTFMEAWIKKQVDLPLTEKPGNLQTGRSMASAISKTFKLTTQYDTESLPLLIFGSIMAGISALVHGCYGYDKNTPVSKPAKTKDSKDPKLASSKDPQPTEKKAATSRYSMFSEESCKRLPARLPPSVHNEDRHDRRSLVLAN